MNDDESKGSTTRRPSARAILGLLAATDAIEMLRIADAIETAFGPDTLRRPSAEIRLKALLIARLDARMKETLTPKDPPTFGAQMEKASERGFWDEAAIRIASAFSAAGRAPSSAT